MGTGRIRLSGFAARFMEHFMRKKPLKLVKEEYVSQTVGSYQEFVVDNPQYYFSKNTANYSASRLLSEGNGLRVDSSRNLFFEKGYGDYCPEHACCTCIATMYGRVRPVIT